MAAEFKQTAVSILLKDELETLKQKIISNMRNANEVASGNTIKSMHVEANEYGGTLFGRKPFGTLETGRKAGKVPYRFSDIIYKWKQDKGIHAAPKPYVRGGQHKYDPQQRGDLSMASAIAWTIHTKGSKLFRTGGRADIYSNVIPDTIKRIGDRIMALIHTSIDTIKLNGKEDIQ